MSITELVNPVFYTQIKETSIYGWYIQSIIFSMKYNDISNAGCTFIQMNLILKSTESVKFITQTVGCKKGNSVRRQPPSASFHRHKRISIDFFKAWQWEVHLMDYITSLWYHAWCLKTRTSLNKCKLFR